MISLSALVYRGKLIESKHKALCLIKDTSNKVILSTNNEKSLIYPRSAIKIFQALPFINSKAPNIFNLNKKIIAISCSSHAGESQHMHILNEWINKIEIDKYQLQCGIHNPLNEQSSNKLLLSGNEPTPLHNNCAGKHLGIISGCIANKMNIVDYVNYSHPYQQLIRESIEYFMESKIQSECIGTDGCNLPQYAFPLSSITTSMLNLIKKKKTKNKYSNSLNIILSSIKQYPLLIGGSNRFDSEIVQFTKGRIFAKGGAEGVLLFADFSKKIGGVIKILDGNNRALPTIAMQIFLKLAMLLENEKKELKNWTTQKLFNHNKKEIGKITAEIK